jgi:predicted O-methyltransferase YrrM
MTALAARLRPWKGCRTSSGEAAISISTGTRGYVDDFLPEDEALIGARRNAAEVGGAAPVSPLTGATIRFVAAAVGARGVVEIGTGCGTSGIWLLRGMRPGSVLTTVDVEPEHQRLARAAYLEAGFPASRYRLIGGLALEVLPRLADGAYDIVFCDADRQEYGDYLIAALRLLRPGGIIIFNGVLPGGSPMERMPAEAEVKAAAELREQVRSDERLVPLLLPVGNGLLAAAKQVS